MYFTLVSFGHVRRLFFLKLGIVNSIHEYRVCLSFIT